MTPEDLQTAIDKLEKRFDDTSSVMESVLLPKKQVLKDALNNQVELVYEFERLRAQADYLEKEGASNVEQYYGYAYTKEMRSPKKVMSTDAKQFASCATDVVEATQLYNRAYKLRRDVEAVAKAIEARGYALKSQTDSLIAGVNGHIL